LFFCLATGPWWWSVGSIFCRRQSRPSSGKDGAVGHRNRWVRTLLDAGRALFGGFGQRWADAPPAVVDTGVNWVAAA
jgi:hypothetical protein